MWLVALFLLKLATLGLENSGMGTPGRTRDSSRMENNLWYIAVTGVLPEGHILVLCKREGILMRLYCDEWTPKLHSLSIFTLNEMVLLLPLLEQYPAYCP